MSRAMPAAVAAVCALVLASTASGAAGDTPPAAVPPPNGLARELLSSVVKVHITVQRADYRVPWQTGAPSNGTGSGLLIGRRRILTNAHIASDVRFIEVQRDADPRRFKARVEHVGHDCDLATLVVDDPDFPASEATPPFAAELPGLNEEVIVLGYPTGGARLSVTRGVVSRVDYSTYSHSGVDQHLVLQVDAAINPGNSGGPILYHGKVVGLAFQGMSWAENIGYGIPTPVLHHFLKDIEDGTYHGYPELGVTFLGTENPALRRRLDLPADKGGVVVSSIDPFGCGRGSLAAGDVLLSISGHPIARDGTIVLDGNTVVFNELLERKQWGESVEFSLIRTGKVVTVATPLTNPPDPYAFRNEYDRQPPYLVFAGLVFSTLSREYLKTLDRSLAGPNDHQLLYYSQYAKVDRLHEGRDAFVVLINRLPHPVNSYAGPYTHAVLSEVNGVAAGSLRDAQRGFAAPRGAFHVLRFEGMEDVMVLDARAASQAHGEILRRYGVPAESRLEAGK